METTNALINYKDPKILQLLKNTVAHGTTDDEFSLFVNMCKSTGLNAVKKEAWCIVTSPDNPSYRKVQMMTGVNGFFAIANTNPMYDGMEQEVGQFVEIAVGNKKIKAPEWVETKVYRKDRSRPQVFRAYWAEFHQPLTSKAGHLTVWGQKPTLMLTKCSESMALRKAFPQELNGWYSQEEMPSNFSLSTLPKEPIATPIPKKEEPLSNSFADDDIPESWPSEEAEVVEEPKTQAVYKYDLESFFENEDRANKLENYLIALKEKGINYKVVEMTLFSETPLSKLESKLIKE